MWFLLLFLLVTIPIKCSWNSSPRGNIKSSVGIKGSCLAQGTGTGDLDVGKTTMERRTARRDRERGVHRRVFAKYRHI